MSVIYPEVPFEGSRLKPGSCGPSLDETIALILRNPDRRITAEVEIDGTTYRLSRWRDGTVALRPCKP